MPKMGKDVCCHAGRPQPVDEVAPADPDPTWEIPGAPLVLLFQGPRVVVRPITATTIRTTTVTQPRWTRGHRGTGRLRIHTAKTRCGCDKPTPGQGSAVPVPGGADQSVPDHSRDCQQFLSLGELTSPLLTTPEGQQFLSLGELTSPFLTTPKAQQFLSLGELTSPLLTTPEGQQFLSLGELTSPFLTTPKAQQFLSLGELTSPLLTTPECQQFLSLGELTSPLLTTPEGQQFLSLGELTSPFLTTPEGQQFLSLGELTIPLPTTPEGHITKS
ncbi:hypothetical protein Bbelb_394700 [Branchiostoma belcheri]|nr:hypothetical protein Bbelb_394700 [Branchiostoma belcheri]